MTTTPLSVARAAAMLAVMMLVLPGCVAEVPPPPASAARHDCRQWAEFPVDRYSNADSPYLGCVSAANLRAMVANPADLDRGRGLGPANGERQTRIIEEYQQGKVKPFQGSGSMSPSGGGQ